MKDSPLKLRIPEDVLERAAVVIKSLGHPLRLRLLEAMEPGEQTVSELQDYTGLSQAAVSQQLGILRAHGVVDGRREGTFVFYRITEPKVRYILECVRSCDFHGKVD